MKNNWQKNLNKLKAMHKKIANSLSGKSIAYIDIPSHYNTGDLLIYLGTESFFSENNLDVRYRALQDDIDTKKVEQCDVIVVHGGGNLGDIYLNHQTKREQFLDKLKHKKIIFLPQSIHYQNDKNLIASINNFQKLKDVTIYVRDKESYSIALKLTDKVELMPDMAHSLHPLIEESEIVDCNEKAKRILNLKRRDGEVVHDERLISKRTFDWWDLCSANDLMLKSLVKLHSRLPIAIARKQILKLWLKQIDYNVSSAIDFVDGHSVVYTDRLHGFILSYLLGKEIILFDNSYQKINRYKSAWFEDCELLTDG